MIKLERFKLARASREWLSDSDLASSADAYVCCLSGRGYAPRTVRIYLETVAHFAHWCDRHCVGLRDIDETVVERYLSRHLTLCRCARRCQRTQPSAAAALGHLLEVLRIEGRIAPKLAPDPATISDEVHRFEHYLKHVCGLKPATCHDRLRHVRAFLLDRFATGSIRINILKPADIVRFISKYTRHWRASSKRHAGNSLRSYFRFKALHGEHTAGLSAAIPTVAQWRLTSLPKGISVDQTTQLLKAFDKKSATGKRDYAITRCFVDLGLRTTEVAALTLDDFDWRQGLVHIRGKRHRVDVLPLPSATGRAIVAYLRHGRPQTSNRAIILRHRPPFYMPATSTIKLASLLQQYFTEQLIQQRHASPYTIAAYRDCFRLLLVFAEQRLRRRPADIVLQDLSPDFVLEFLEHLEKERQNSIRSRNARFAAVRAFPHYAAAKEPSALAITQSVLAIPMKRFERPLVGFFSREQIQAILDAPDSHTWSGRRDRVMFSTLYNTGARVSELIHLRIADVSLEASPAVHILGKGRKERHVPLWSSTAKQIKRWLRDEKPRGIEQPLFPNRKNGWLTRTSVAERLQLAVRMAATKYPELSQRRISPHLFRHSLAMHLLQAGVDISVIALWLGHESTATTHMYVEADLAMKERALKRLQAPRGRSPHYRPRDSVLEFLQGL